MQGSTGVRFIFRVYDEFGVYPRKLDVSVDHSQDGYYAILYRNPEPA